VDTSEDWACTFHDALAYHRLCLAAIALVDDITVAKYSSLEDVHMAVRLF